MKHLKTFEKYINFDDLIHKYEKYLNKFFLSSHKLIHDEIFMCKLIKIKKDFISFEYYEFDESRKGYEVSDNSIHIRDFDKYYKILNSFDTFKEMEEKYEIINNAKKYNL